MAKGDGKSKADSLLQKQAAEQAAKLVDIRSQIKGFDTRAWFVETLKYAAWVIIFTMSIFANRGTTNQYNYVDLWRAQARAGIPEPFATQVHFWEMIENSMLPMLGPAALVERNDDGNSTGYFTYPSSEGDYGLAYKSPLNANESITRLAWNGNVIVDGIWIRQLRTSSVNCSNFGNLAQTSMPCFPAWSSDSEEKFYAKLSVMSPGSCCYLDSEEPLGVEYEYFTADKLNFTTYRRGLNRYHGGGFVARLNDPNTASDYVQLLKDNRWIDLKTRIILTAFCVFNINNQLFLCMHITVEVDDLGKYTLDQRYFPVNLDAYDLSKPSTFLKLGLQGYVAFWVLYYIVEEIKQMRQSGLRAYFSELWNCIDVLNLLFFLIAGWFQFQAVMLLRSMSADPNLVSSPKLLATGDYTDSYTMLNSVNALVMWFKIFKYISITKRLTRISKALFKAMPDVSAFFFVFVVLFIGFGICAHLLFGNDIQSFSSVGEAFLTLFRMMLGDWDYEAIMLSAPLMGPIWFIMWIVVSAIILLNFIVGVLGEAYNQVMEEEEEEAAKNPKLDVLDIIAVKAKQGVGINVDLAALAGIEQKMDEADASGDGNVDLTELQKLMGDIDLSKAFPGKSPKEIMAMFDKDGNGVLDKQEMMEFKKQFRNISTGSGPAPSLADSGANAAPNSGALAAQQQDGATGSAAAGCAGPGGFCCCRCGCPKGGSAMGERRAMERVELTLLRLESVMKDRGKDDDDAGASSLMIQEDDDEESGSARQVSGAFSAKASVKGSVKRNSVAPL